MHVHVLRSVCNYHVYKVLATFEHKLASISIDKNFNINFELQTNTEKAIFDMSCYMKCKLYHVICSHIQIYISANWSSLSIRFIRTYLWLLQIVKEKYHLSFPPINQIILLKEIAVWLFNISSDNNFFK